MAYIFDKLVPVGGMNWLVYNYEDCVLNTIEDNLDQSAEDHRFTELKNNIINFFMTFWALPLDWLMV